LRYFATNDGWDNLNRFGGNFLEQQLRDNHSGKLRTWFIKWHASTLIQNGFCLFPKESLVDNIGFDSTGIHNETTEFFSHKKLADHILVHKVPLKESALAERVIRLFYLRLRNGHAPMTYRQKVKKSLLKMIPFKNQWQRIINKITRWAFPELQVFKNPNYNRILLTSVESDTLFGKNCKVYKPFQLYDVQIGNYTYVARNSFISQAIIGKFCSIGPNFMCGRGVHPTNGISTAPMFYSTSKQNGMTLSLTDKIIERKTIVIGNDVFIGANVTMLDGVVIGDGAVIGAGAVVSKDIPPYAIAVGAPIQIIKYRFSEEQIESLLKICWWNFNDAELAEVEKNFFDIDLFIKKYIHA
jgi:acetyltransferase-like isoleucine patch superfamily enzyme